MQLHTLQRRLLTTVRPGLAAAVLFTFALLSACSNDSASRISAPPTLSLTRERSSGGGGSGSSAASGFAVLANAEVTCTASTIVGNVGTFQAPPTGKVTQTSCPITGAVHRGDAAAVQAFNAFLTAYSALAPKSTDNCPVITGTLAGATFAPGVYCLSSEEKTGVVTLNGPPSATWIFKVPSGALSGTNFSVVMAGGGQACNVTWWAQAATTLTTSAFQGNILSGAGITVTGPGTLNGNAWAKADATFSTSAAVTGCAASGGSGGGKDDDHGDKGDKDRDKDKDKDHHDRDNDHHDRDNDRDHGDSDGHHSSNGDNGGHHGESDEHGGF